MAKNVNDVMALFKERQTLIKGSIDNKKTARGFDKKPPIKQSKGFDHYSSYQQKLDRGLIDNFNTRDMAYFFRDIANENGNRYVISNIMKDMKCFKTCLSRDFNNRDILSMIEFIFTSGQKYLDTKQIQPTILMSNWCNTLITDTELWLNDEYDPNAPKYKKSSTTNVQAKEWKEEVTDAEQAEIGEWGY